MSYSRHATAPDQFPVEQFAGAFPANANRLQRPPRHWISLLDEEQVGAAVRAVLEETICRPALLGRTPPRDVARNLHSKMEKALRGTFLDIHSSNECTVHPANCLCIQARQDLAHSVRYTNEHYSHMLICWASELEKYAEMVCHGEKGRKYMFLLKITFGVLQIMSRPGASFSSVELVSTLTSMVQRYKKSYIEECWVPLKNALYLNLDEFTAEFLDICGNQRTWKVTAELRYKLREEIRDLIVPSYEASLSALQAKRSRFSEVLCSFRRVIAGKKKQRKYTSEELEEKIMALFEG